MRLLPPTGTKTAVHNTLESRHKDNIGQKFNGTQIKTTIDQKFSNPQKKSTELPVFSQRQLISTVKPNPNDYQQKDVNMRSNSPAMVLNIPVADNEESKEDVQTGECKRLEDLMSNLSVSGEPKTQRIHKKENDFSKKTESLNDSFLKLNISGRKNDKPLQKDKKEKDEEGELIERGPVISSKKLQSPAVHPYTKSVLTLSARYSLQSGGVVAEQPYINSYNCHVPIIPQTVEEISNNPIISVSTNNKEEVVTQEISPDIFKEENSSFHFILNELPALTEWADKALKKCDDKTTYLIPTEVQLPVFNEPAFGIKSPYYCEDSAYENTSPHCSRDSIYGNTSPHCSGDSAYGSISPHCSRDSTYGTLSPDSNVISPMSYASPMSSPGYTGNEFTNETLFHEIVTVNSSSDSSLLLNEPIASLDLYDLIEDLEIDKNSNGPQQNKQHNDFDELDKPNIVENQPQQTCQFDKGYSQNNSAASQDIHVMNNNKFTTEMFHNNSATQQVLHVVNQELPSNIPCSNSITPQIHEVVNSKLSAEMSHTSTMPTTSLNVKLPSINIDQSWNFAPYSINQFDNSAAPNIVTVTAPPKHLVTIIPSIDNVQPNVMNRQTICIPAKLNKQNSPNKSVMTTTPKFIYGHNVVPNIGTELFFTTTKSDKSVDPFVYGDSANIKISKPVPVNSTIKLGKPTCNVQPVRPAERQILPAGPEVYETGMSIPAAVRLKILMKNKDFTVQYVKVCHELANKPELLKERLFQLLSNNPKTQNWLICICAHIALTVSMKSKATVLTARNGEGHSLLYLACVNHPDEPMIARYIADSLLDLNFSPDEMYDSNGNSLLHLLALLGDSHVIVLAELLNVCHPLTGQRVCNVNRPNNSQMETPLHVAVSRHSLPHISSLATVKLLITHGANVAAQNIKKMTPLHCAVQGNCDPNILKLLLQSNTSRAALDVIDSEHNTALHLAAANNSITALKSLIGHGANYRIQNMDGKMALELVVDTERHQEIKKLFLKKRML